MQKFQPGLNAKMTSINRSNIKYPSDIPNVFCWTKMGTEAGQPLEAILHRKELERQSGNGLFAWGIGNSLGTSAELARKLSPGGEVDVLFTPMKSAPKQVDVSPSQLLLWLGYVGVGGHIVSLPKHMLVTSRGGAEKRGHYALLCYSQDEIKDDRSGFFDASSARNLASLNPIGASQVTSIVRYDCSTQEELEKPYPIAFRAKLHAQGFVKLACPVVMNECMMALYRAACAASTPTDWADAANTIHALARSSGGLSVYNDLFAALT
jgi:hypothetical protein